VIKLSPVGQARSADRAFLFFQKSRKTANNMYGYPLFLISGFLAKHGLYYE